MKKTGLLLLFILAVNFTAVAQGFSLGNVSVAELKEKMHPTDTAAPAAILFKNGKSYFEIQNNKWRLCTEIEWRIKIYKKEGYEYANQQLYYAAATSSKAYFEDAYTYNLAGDKIEKTKLRSDGEIDERISETMKVKKIMLPNVKEGSVIEFKTIVKSLDIGEFPDWNFQYHIPVNNVSYKVSIPEYFSYNRYMVGYLNVTQSQGVKVNVAHGFTETIFNYSAANVEAVKDEAYVDNIKNYMSILKYELASEHPPKSNPIYYSTNWNTLIKNIYKDERFGGELETTSYFEKDLAPVIASAKTREEKIAAIFTFVQSRMKWNEYTGYIRDKGVKKAYAEKTGNVADINLMLTAMLRYAGLKANPVLISTRNNGIALFATWSAYNYVIAAVETENGTVLLDATSKYTLPDVLPVRAINWQGRLVRKAGSSEEIKLVPKANARELININAAITADGKIAGKVNEQYFDHNALNHREYYADESTESYLEKLEKRYGGIEISDYNVANKHDLNKPLIEDFSFVQNNGLDIIGNKIYFNPLLFFTVNENPFKQENRLYPVNFVYRNTDRYIVNIAIPDGYVVESMPSPVSLSMNNDLGSFKYVIGQQGKNVQVSVTYNINQAVMASEHYATIKDFFRKMIEKQTEKVVLKKA